MIESLFVESLFVAVVFFVAFCFGGAFGCLIVRVKLAEIMENERRKGYREGFKVGRATEFLEIWQKRRAEK